MEDNVALDSSKQKKFVKSIKSIKKLIKRNEAASVTETISPEAKSPKGNKRKRRGLVYLSHIPHGFYENEMTQYFKQFGVVTNSRVIRSKRTGNSKGFAFVEFREPSVAQIVAETMNNYLMGKRLIKAVYIPPEKQRPNAMRKNWNSLNNPTSNLRINIKKAFNENKDEAGELQKAKKLMKSFLKTKTKLETMGISYDFFAPVDVPEALKDSIVHKIKVDDIKSEDDLKSQKKINKKEKAVVKLGATKSVAKDSKLQMGRKEKNVVENKINKSQGKETNKKEAKQVNVLNKNEKVKSSKENKTQQSEKEIKLKAAGVKSVEEFININQESDDEDSDYEFDSDEYDKMLEAEDESGSESLDDESADENTDLEDDASEEEEQPIKKSFKPTQMNMPKAKKNVPPQPKRKASQKPAQSPKKPKFEKQVKKAMNKQHKKKK